MRGRVGPLLGAAGLVLLVVLSAVPASAEDPSSGTPLSVTVTDGSTATPTPTALPSGGSSPSAAAPAPGTSTRSGTTGTPGGAGSSSGGGAGAGAGTPSGSTTPTGEVNVAGMLYIGGVNVTTTPSLNPAEGVADVWFTVRNASTSVIDATASFSMDSVLFAQRLDAVEDVPVAGLQPGETRVVTARLQHGGQWTLLSTHATLTPPESIDGTKLTPVTRDALALLFPWLVVLVVVLLVLGIVLIRVLRAMLVAAPDPVVAA